MTDISSFKSRTGKLACDAEEAFGFVTDIRNFNQFIPQGTINNWQAEKDSCSFNVSMIGNVSFRITGKEANNKVVFTGDALKKNDFTLELNIIDNQTNRADVKIFLNAEMNPVLKMMAVKPIGQFLEILIKEMENFSGWNETRE